MAKIAHEKWDTYQNVFDDFTLRNIFRLESQGHFVELESTVSMGKEANTFSARCLDGTYVIIKIYRLETCDFNRLYDYIKYDPRYQGLRRQRRKIIFAWCQREYRNLLKLREAGVRVPKPIAFLNNVLVMEQIDDGKEVAPKLKDSYIDNPQEMTDKIINLMIMMYQKAGLIHGDLSAYNILNMNQEPVIIDVSQSMPLDAQTSADLLARDIKNMIIFFKKLGIVVDEEDLHKKITGK
ncbi:serine protein kinase RIO [Candidatus Woesearchaeota archaeon]|nr:serine protein kinase RIO [Candidatus Woesearchaeota archaeon]